MLCYDIILPHPLHPPPTAPPFDEYPILQGTLCGEAPAGPVVSLEKQETIITRSNHIITRTIIVTRKVTIVTIVLLIITVILFTRNSSTRKLMIVIEVIGNPRQLSRRHSAGKLSPRGQHGPRRGQTGAKCHRTGRL